MTKTYELTQVKITEDFTTQVDGEVYELEKDEIVAADRNVASNLVNIADVGNYTGKKQEVKRESGEEKQRIITLGDLRGSASNDDNGAENSDSFDFETYVDEHNADPVIEDVEEHDSVTWLENLANHDTRKTVQSAIESRLEELENDE